MLASARRWAWRKPGVYALPPGPGRNVGRAISPAAWGLRYRRVSGTMQASSPTKHRARSCRALQDIFAARPRPQRRAHDFARRLGFAASQGFRDDASIVPYGCGGKVLPGFAGYLWGKAAVHPSVCALRRIHLPLQGRLWGDRHPEGSPVRGAVGASRLRGAVPCLANILPGRRKSPRRA